MYPVYYVPAGDVLPVFWDTFDGGTGASITLTGLAVTDIEIFKDGSVTQRASDAGYTLLDTDGIDFDGITGIHGFSIDTGDNTDAGFYTVGAWYHVVVSSVTVDAQTVNFIACAFRIMAAEDSAGVPDVNVTHFGGTAGTFASGRPEVNTTHAAGTAWNSGAIGASTLAADTITAAKIAADAIGASELAADAVAEIADGVWDEDATGHQTGGTFGQAIGDPGADTTTIYQSVVTDAAGANIAADIAAIEAQTDDIGVAGAGLTAIPWNAAWDAEVESEANDALVANHLDHLLAADYDPAAKPGVATALLNELVESDAGVSRYTANALEQAPTGGSAPSAATIADAVWDEARTDHVTNGSFGQAAQVVRSGTAQAGGASTITLDASASATDDIYNGAVVYILSGTGAGQARQITDYVGSTKVATVDTAWTTNPDATSVFVLYPGPVGASAGEIADAVWDEAQSGHTSAGTFGEIATEIASVLDDTGTSGVVLANDAITAAKIAADAIGASELAADAVAEIADAIWDEAQSGHISAGTFGEIATEIADILTDTGTTLQAELDGIQADTEDIQTRLPAALVSGRIDSSVGAMAANTLTASALAADAVTEIQSGLSTLDAAGVRSAVGLASANLDTQLGDLPTATETADALLDRSDAVETGLTPRQALRLAAAALAGKLSGGGTTTITIRNAVQDSKARITATVDSDGNRSAITYDVS